MIGDVRAQLAARTYLTNAGTETYLVFQQGYPLPDFCAFVVHEDQSAWNELEQNYLYRLFKAVALSGCGLIVDTLVWRAHPDYLAKLGRGPEQLGPINERAVAQTRASVDRWRAAEGHDEASFPVLIAADL